MPLYKSAEVSVLQAAQAQISCSTMPVSSTKPVCKRLYQPRMNADETLRRMQKQMLLPVGRNGIAGWCDSSTRVFR